MTANQFKRRSEKLGLSIAETAKRMGKCDRTICRWRSGETDIPDGAIKLFLHIERELKETINVKI